MLSGDGWLCVLRSQNKKYENLNFNAENLNFNVEK
jgi:hypothetical protein